MRDMQQGTIWGNLRPIREADRKLGNALIEFGRMIEDGRALCRTPSGLPHLMHPKNEYRSNSPRLAQLSIERALRQHAKGNITDADLAEIVARCGAVVRGDQ